MKKCTAWMVMSTAALVQACGGAGQEGERADDTASPSTPYLRGQLHTLSGAVEVPYEIKNGLAVSGDLILGDPDAVAQEQREVDLAKVGKHPLGHRLDLSTTAGAAARWSASAPNNVINYSIDSSTIDVPKLRQEMRNWEAALSGGDGTPSAFHPHFVECTYPCSVQECSMYQCPYLVRVVANAGLGCNGQSAQGRWPNSPTEPFQYLNIPRITECSDPSATMRHELGHVLGLEHEHQRADRETYVHVDPSLLTNGNWSIRNIGAAWRPDGRYDFQSVVHYGASQNIVHWPHLLWNMTLANGALLPLPAGNITAGDVAALDAVYVAGASDPTTPLAGHASPSSPAPAGAARGSKHVVAMRAQNDHLYTREKTGTSWAAWDDKWGIIHSSPGVAIKPDGSVLAVAIGSDNATPCYWDAGWSCSMGSNPTGYVFDTTPVPTDTSGSPAVWIGDDGGIHVVIVARHATNYIHTILANDKPLGTQAWTGWYVISSVTPWGTPAIASIDGRTSHIFYTGGVDDGIHVNGANINFPQGTQPPPGILWGTGVSAAPVSSGRYGVFVVGNDNRIWMTQPDPISGVWGWKPYGGPAKSLPGAAGVAGSQLELFFAMPDYPAETEFPVTIDGVWYPFLNNAVWHKMLF